MNQFSDQSFFNPLFLNGLYDGVADAVFIVGKNHQIRYANSAALSLCGMEFEQITTKKISLPKQINNNGPLSGKFNNKTLNFTPGFLEETPLNSDFKNVQLSVSSITIGKSDVHVLVFQAVSNEKKELVFQDALLEIAQASNTAYNLDKFYREIHQILKKYINAKNFYIAIYDQDAQFIRFPYYVDERDYLEPEDALIKARNRKKKRGLTEYLLYYGEPLLLTEEDINLLSQQEEISIIGSLPKYWLGAPLKKASGETLGVLAVQSYQTETRYTQNDKTLLSFIASQVAINLEKKQIEEKLNIERDLFTNGPVVIFKLLVENNQQIKTLYVSQNIRQFGYHPKEFLSGKISYQQIVHPDDHPTVFNNDRLEFINSRAYVGEKFRILTAAGEVRWVFDFTYIYRQENEDFTEYNFYILDITDQKEVESQLQILNQELEKRVRERTIQLSETQDFLQMLINTIPAPVYYKNEHGTYLGCNTAYAQLTGLSRQDLIEKSALDVWPETVSNQYHDIDLGLIKSGGKAVYEVNVPTKTGQNLDAIIRKATFKNANDEVVGLVGVLLDITERKRAEQLQNVLYRISEAAGSTEDIDSLYPFVHEIVKQLIPAKNFFIALYNPDLDLIHFPYYVDEITPEPPQPRKIRLGMTERVIRDKKALFMTREKMVEIFEKAKVTPRGKLPYQWLGVPLKTQKDKIIGVVVVQTYDQTEISYTKDDQTLLEIISRQIATAIERKQTQEQLRLLNKELEGKVYERTQQLNAQLVELKQRERELTAVVEVAQALRQIERPEQIYSIVIDILCNTMEAQGCSIAILDETKNEIRFVNSSGAFSHQKELVIPVETGAAGWVIRNKKPYLNNNIQRDPGPTILNYMGEVNALLIAPLIMEDRVFGLVEVGANQLWTEDDQRLLVAIAEITANALHRELLDYQRGKQLTRLNTLREIDRMITGKIDLYDSLSFLLNQIVNQLKVDAADILLAVSSSTFLDYGRGVGFKQSLERETLVSVRQGPAEAAISRGEPLLILDINRSKTWKDYFSELNSEKFVFYYAIPLKTKGQILGVLELFHRSPLSVDEDWTDFAFALSQQTAIAIENAQLFDKLQKVNRDLLYAYDKTIAGWAKALELRDQETGGHSMKVMEMTIKLAQLMGIRNAEELTHIRRGALLHDIGKMAIPDHILLKPEKLNNEELLEMKKHPQYAWELLYPIEFLRPALDIPLYHHERWDGSGYPYGLKAQEIPFPARIFAVIDVFHALISDRPYSEPWKVEEALKYIVENKSKLFDPDVVNQFIRVLKTSGFLG